MKAVVVDASVAAKWFLPSGVEPLRAEAVALLNQYAHGELRFLVPDLFWAELANIFWKAVRQGRWSGLDGAAATKEAAEQGFSTFASKTLLEDAFAIASTFDRTVYDSLYIALALVSKSDFVTADERLADAVAAHLPVKWLGSLG